MNNINIYSQVVIYLCQNNSGDKITQLDYVFSNYFVQAILK